MSQVAELLKEASKLDRSEWAELVSSLLEDLDPSPHRVSDEDALRRLRDLKAGKFRIIELAELLPPPETPAS